MARAIWRGAISFGLVHIPVSLINAVSSTGIDFDWLDKRSMEPVGYKQINKITGKDIDRKNIVKGVQYEKGQYVLISEDEIKSAHPRATQTIDIFSFIDKGEIPITHIDTPYYLAPDKRGEKVYALLREALVGTNKVALANVILRVRQHLAVLMPVSSALVLILLRWPAEVRGLEMLELTDAVVDANLSKSEKDMAKRLIDDMTASWEPEEYRDTFQEKIMALIEQKASEGRIEAVEQPEEGEGRRSADVIDLTELLKRSLTGNSGKGTSQSKSGKGAKVEDIKTGSKASASKAAVKSSTGRKSAASAKPKSKAAKTASKTAAKKTDEQKTRTPRKASK